MKGDCGQKYNLIATCIPLDRIRVPLDRTSIPLDRTFISLDCTFLLLDKTANLLPLAFLLPFDRTFVASYITLVYSYLSSIPSDRN